MDIETSSAIRLFFPNPSLVLVYFEALANALDAEATDISIRIEIQSFDEPSTLKVTVTDNGSGFTDDNYARFKTLLKPRDNFHKGLGRLIFLKYFELVEITSTWGKNQRSFVFKDNFDGIAPIHELAEEQSNCTQLIFRNFSMERVKSYEDLKPECLKERIIEHFLPTLNERRRQNVDFKITVSLSTNQSNEQKEFFSSDVTITPADLPELTQITIKCNTIDAFDSIEMFYHINTDARKTTTTTLLTAVNVDGRTIPINIIQPNSVPVGYSAVFFFASDIFKASADSSRQKLILPESISSGNLYNVLRDEVGKILAENIPQITEKNNKTREQFEVQFPHLLGYFEETTVGLIDRDESLNVAQQKFFKAQKEILQCESLDDKAYEKSLELSSRTLTEYVLYREKIIRRMKSMSEDNSEADIHNLIVPRFNEYKQSDIVSDIYQNNAWLLDDKFMTFRTILSEVRMDNVINSIRLEGEPTDEEGRPDIAMIFSADPEDTAAVDVVVVEIKKKTDKEKENQYVVNQLLDRAVKLAAHCPNIQRIWYYAVIQINDIMSTRLRQQKWAPLFSKGKIFYQEFPTERPNGTVVPTPIFIVSFDAIVSDAECRNHTFLEILRGGMRKHMEKQARLAGLKTPKKVEQAL